MVAFELQTYQGGAWRIDSLFNDRKLAVMEAERLSKGDRYSAVRLVEENYDPRTQSSTSKVIFRVSRLQDQREAAFERQRQVQVEVEETNRTIRAAASEHKAQRLKRRRQGEMANWISILVIRGGGILLIGICLLYGLGRLAGKF